MLKKVDDFIKMKPFTIAGVCKDMQPNTGIVADEGHILHLPIEIILHIINFLEPGTLGIKYSESTLENTEVENIEVENMGVTEILEVVENSYCILL
ncbi:hypothetical protein [Rickettsia endosymbiont of Polydrusus tereticollis]|uniref:hypothetical protein n=1 Tax=Rickettsia endosymbiont of Polydrusus tereticollis TaxID=3066251 RepID=UPI003132FA7B